MKKILLTMFALLVMGGATYAEEVTVLVPDEEYTSVGALDGKVFAIVNTTEGKALYNPDAQKLVYDTYFKAFASSNAGYYWKLISLDNNADEAVHGCYALRAVKPDGSTYSFWGWGEPYLNSQPEGREDICFCLCLGDNLGQDVKYGAVWEVEYVANKGFTLKNKAMGGYFTSPNSLATSNTPAYFSFCSLKEGKMENPIEKGAYDATDAKTDCFTDDYFTTIDNGATWDPATRTFTKRCGFKWAEGIDLSHYKYIVITAAQSRENAGAGNISIKDASGTTVQGDDYQGEKTALWLSLWNSLNSCVINLEKLRTEKLFDIYHVAELSIDGGDKFILGNVYATNFETAWTGRWENKDNEGNFRIKNLTDEKYGTVCLPYQAAVSGAYIYEITGKDEGTLELSMYNGLLEAGKPYFYQVIKGFPNDQSQYPENRVYFYQATAATVTEAGENNGLIGTFEEMKAPKKSFVLKDNFIYYVDSDVTVGANKAYIDMKKIVNTSATAKAFIDFDEIEDVTGINAVDAEETLNGTFYDLSGREVTNPTPGIYIVNGKKVVIK